jgi:hypothetical protein
VNESAVAVQAPQQARPLEMTVADVRAQNNLVKQVLQEVMQRGHHYGSVPGAKGEVLFKAGAEKLALVFRLSPAFVIQEKQLANAHREYVVTCTMTHIGTGTVLGSGVGSCSTMETKYRYRWKGEGKNRARTENPDIADVYNTCLKMAKKRAQVDATLTVTGASDIFAPEEPEGDEHDDAKDAPHEEPTKREILLRDCGLLCGKIGGDATVIREVFAAAGLPLGRTLQSLSDAELERAKEALTAAAAKGGTKP